MATIPAAGYISNAARTQGELKQSLEDVIASLRQIPGAGQAELNYTIASGSVTPGGSGGIITIDTESSAATDDLTNIVTTNYPDGSCLIVRNFNASRFVVIKNAAGGAGQINLDRSADYTLDDTKKWILIQRRSADWYEVLRGPTRMTTLTVAKTSTFTVNVEDLGKTFLCSGTYTVNLLAAATAGNGFVVVIRNTGTGTLTIDPNASETIDGLTTLAVPPAWSYELICTGSAWQTILSTASRVTANPLINGSMEVWQRNTTLASATGTAWVADRWLYQTNGSAGICTINRSTNVPTVSQAGLLLNYSYEIDVTTLQASMAAGDYFTIRQRIEGPNWRPFAQRTFTLSFWVMSTKTGTHCVAFRNGTVADRSYVAEYTVNATDTWEYKTITVPASPSAGTWSYTAGNLGLELSFVLAVGSTYQTTAGAWQTGNFHGTSNQVNDFDSTSNFFRLAAVKMELGTVATPLEFVSFEHELYRCLRYYQKSFLYTTAPAQNVGTSGAYQFTAPATSTAAITVTVNLQVPMRTNATITLYNPTATNAQVRNTTDAADDSTSSTTGYEKEFILTFTPNATNTLGDTHAVQWAADAEL